MTKEQFLRELRTELSGKIPEKELQSQLDFYEEYIRTRSVRSTEAEVTGELGSPRLIAKSILASRSADGTKADEIVYEDGSSAKEEKRKGRRILQMPSWVFITLAAILIAAGVFLVLTVAGYLLPVLLPLLLLYFVIRLIVKNRRQ